MGDRLLGRPPRLASGERDEVGGHPDDLRHEVLRGVATTAGGQELVIDLQLLRRDWRPRRGIQDVRRLPQCEADDAAAEPGRRLERQGGA